VNTLPPGTSTQKVNTAAHRGVKWLLLHRLFQSPGERNPGRRKPSSAPCASRHVLSPPVSAGRQGGQRAVGRRSAWRTIGRPQAGQSTLCAGVSPSTSGGGVGWTASLSWAARPSRCWRKAFNCGRRVCRYLGTGVAEGAMVMRCVGDRVGVETGALGKASTPRSGLTLRTVN